MISGDPVISFVMPTFNRAGYIGDAVKSVLDQDSGSWELLIIDDGSTDQTEQVVSCFPDERIRYFKTSNRERGAARNFGVSMARGLLVSFIDSDDLIEKHTVSSAIDVITKNPYWTVFHFGYVIRDINGGLVSPAEKLPAVTNSILIKRNVIGCHAIFIIRDVLIGNPFSEDRVLSGSEDYELWLRLASRYKIHHINMVTACLRNHSGRSMFNTDLAVVERRVKKLLKLALGDEKVRTYIGADIPIFKAYRYSYISLYAASAGNRILALTYLYKAVRKSTGFLFSYRALMIVLKMFPIIDKIRLRNRS